MASVQRVAWVFVYKDDSNIFWNYDEKMGTLSFSFLEVRWHDADDETATNMYDFPYFAKSGI